MQETVLIFSIFIREIARKSNIRNKINTHKIQQTFSGSNTDGSFNMAVSNSFLSPLEIP